MNVPVKTSSGINLVPLDSRLFERRTICLESEITHEKAMEFSKELMDLVTQNSDETIKVLINSQGGMIDAGMVIYDLIQSATTPISLYCIGQAYSMAAIIFLSGKHGRYMLPNSKLMLHQPLIHTCPGGSASSMKSLSDSLIQEKNRINNIIAKHTGMTKRQVEKATAYDHFYTAEEAIAENLADEVVDLHHML